ncbi:hypothetical protein V8G54_019025, partial [Vigna mungo]
MLSALDKTGGIVSETLNNHVMQGKSHKNKQNSKDAWSSSEVQLDIVSKTKGVVAAEEFFSGLPPPAKNKNTYGALLNCYCKELMKDRALSYFDKMGYVTYLAFSNLM